MVCFSFVFVWALVGAPFLVAAQPSPAPTMSEAPVMRVGDLPLMTVDELVLSDPDTTTLAAAFTASGLLGVLCQNCNYTVFA